MNYLFIELSASSLTVSSEFSQQSELFKLVFSDKKDYRYKEQLNQFFEENNLFKREYDECIISWANTRSTLVPNNVFVESNPSALMKLCYGEGISANDIDYNRISEQGFVNTYELPQWVKGFFILKYPRSVIQHEGSHVIRGIFKENAFQLKASIILHEDYFLLTLIKENKLLFYSTYSYTQAEDVVYHLMFTLQQKELLNSNGTVEIIQGVGAENGAAESIAELLKKVKDLEKMKVNIPVSFMPKSLLLCV